MAIVELIIPKMGESLTEVTITKWLKKEGDKVEVDEPVLEIATDKVDSDMPSPVTGTLGKILFKEQATVAIGTVIATINTEAETNPEVVEAAAAAKKQDIAPEKPKPLVTSEKFNQDTSAMQPTISKVDIDKTPIKSDDKTRFYSPLVLNIAQKEQISISELERMKGSGKEGRVTKKDILLYIKNRLSPSAIATESKIISDSKTTNIDGNVEIIEMDRIRKLIAEHMTMSKKVSAHVTSFAEADVTDIVNWRNKIKDNFIKREGEKITFTPIFIEAVVKAIKDFPMINASVEGSKIIIKKDLNIGVATALPTGNLIVPVIKQADKKNLTNLTKEINDLVNRARNNQLNPTEIEGGTFSFTNIGTFKNLMGTPIINQPQVAILAIGIIKKKPVVLETNYGDVIGIRHMMFLSLSYDHRIVDGALGGSFLQKVVDYLEKFDVNKSI